MKTSYFLLIGLCFFTLTYFLGDKVLSPFNAEGDLVNINLLIMAIFSSITITSLFTFIHLGIDRLFRNDDANMTLAIRRGILLSATIVILAYFRIFALWSVLNLALISGIVLLIEIFFSLSTPKSTDHVERGKENVL